MTREHRLNRKRPIRQRAKIRLLRLRSLKNHLRVTDGEAEVDGYFVEGVAEVFRA